MKSFLEDVLHGLAFPQKRIPSKYFYDQRGSELFERICLLEEYYPYRCEIEILAQEAERVAKLLSRRCCLIEFGSGSSRKTRILLEQLSEGSYVPIDVADEFLRSSAGEIAREYPYLNISPVCADFTAPFDAKDPLFSGKHRNAIFFPGSTIGNFEPRQAREILRMARAISRENGLMIVGVDLTKQISVLESAYDDAEGVTAAFNMNLLVRMNRELAADFDVSSFSHQAFFNKDESRIEMHLVSKKPQAVRIDGKRFRFEPGESIHTESSYKYDARAFAELAKQAGFSVSDLWMDSKKYFAVYLLEAS